MSYIHLLSPERREFVIKSYNEMYNNAEVNFERESMQDYFFSLVKKNKELSKNEIQYCKEKFIYDFELENATNKSGKPKKCNKCKMTKYSDRFCEGCFSLQLQSLFTTWTSGNNIVDDFIQQCQMKSALPYYILEWIPYEEFKKVTKLAEGGFSSIYTAVWTRGIIIDYDENKKEFSYYGRHDVVLKSLNNSNNPEKAFFDEAINYTKIKLPFIVPCYGITKFPDNGNYAIVLNYHSDGSLRDYFQKSHLNLTLKDRIIILMYLCIALYFIHCKDLIHCDLHSGNILLQGSGCYITDLGLCGPVDEKSLNKVYGIVSYVAPELLNGKKNIKNTKETDIYSVGMLMWEIFAGHPPFDKRAHNFRLIIDICEGLRPPILPEMPDDYVQMMKKCWDVDPSKRPTILELYKFADNKYEEIFKNESLKKNNSNKSLIKRLFKFLKNGKHVSGDSQQAHKSHPEAYHKSRILDEEIGKSKSLKLYTSNDSSLKDLDFNSLLLNVEDANNNSKERMTND